MHYRTVWISDLHLGSRGCRAAELSRFLKHLRCERLYLVGDVLDLWRLRSRWYWPAEHNDVIRRLLNHARHHCQVIYLPGNHDEAARHSRRRTCLALPWLCSASDTSCCAIYGRYF